MPVPLMIAGGMALTSLAMATSIAFQNYANLIVKNKDLTTTKKDKDKKQIEPPKEPDEKPDLGTVAETVAKEIIKDKYKTYEESYPTIEEQTERALKELKTKKIGVGNYDIEIGDKKFNVFQSGEYEPGGTYWSANIYDKYNDPQPNVGQSWNTLRDAKDWILENWEIDFFDVDELMED